MPLDKQNTNTTVTWYCKSFLHRKETSLINISVEGTVMRFTKTSPKLLKI